MWSRFIIGTDFPNVDFHGSGNPRGTLCHHLEGISIGRIYPVRLGKLCATRLGSKCERTTAKTLSNLHENKALQPTFDRTTRETPSLMVVGTAVQRPARRWITPRQ